MSGHERARGETAGAQGASRIESKPAYPQKARADKTQHDAMRQKRLARISYPLAEIERAHQCRNSRADVHHRSAREIQGRKSSPARGIQESTLAPNHMRQRSVNHAK